MSIRWDDVERMLLEAAERGMEVAGRQMETRAIALAPVRKVFQGQRDITKAPAKRAQWRSSRTNRFVSYKSMGEDDDVQMLHRRGAPFAGNARIRNRRTPERQDTQFARGTRAGRGAASERALETRYIVQHVGGAHNKAIRGGVHGSELTFDERGRPSYRRSAKMLPHNDPRTKGPRFSLENTAGQVLNTRGNYELRSGRAYFEHPSGSGVTLGGRLRASIELGDPEDTEKGKELRLSAGGEKAYYAIYQELGTRHHPAHPFLRPALDEAAKYYPKYIERAIKNAGL